MIEAGLSGPEWIKARSSHSNSRWEDNLSMLRPSDSVPSMVEHLASRAQATPSYLGQGLGASLATHVLAVSGYSLYLLCATWLLSADLPEWMPPQSGVRSRPQAASQAIVLEATFSERAEQDNRPIVLQPQLTSLPETPTPPDALDTPVRRTDNTRPLLAQRSAAELPETVADSFHDHAPLPDRQMENPEVERELLETPRSAQVPKRGHGAAVQTITSVASSAAQESHGAESEALPQQVFSPEPEYPAQQYRDRVGGRVRIRIQLGPGGRVTDATIYSSSGVVALDEAALQAVRQWRFESSSTSHPTVRELIVPIRFIPPQN